jgi:hypothetical protein
MIALREGYAAVEFAAGLPKLEFPRRIALVLADLKQRNHHHLHRQLRGARACGGAFGDGF